MYRRSFVQPLLLRQLYKVRREGVPPVDILILLLGIIRVGMIAGIRALASVRNIRLFQLLEALMCFRPWAPRFYS